MPTTRCDRITQARTCSRDCCDVWVGVLKGLISARSLAGLPTLPSFLSPCFAYFLRRLHALPKLSCGRLGKIRSWWQPKEDYKGSFHIFEKIFSVPLEVVSRIQIKILRSETIHKRLSSDANVCSRKGRKALFYAYCGS